MNEFSSIYNSFYNPEVIAYFFDLAIDLFCIGSKDGDFLKLNIEWESITGYKLTELEGQNIKDFIHPDDFETTTEQLNKLNSNLSVYNFVNRFKKLDGNYIWLEWRAYPVENLIFAAARNITEQKLFTNKLSETLEFNNNIFAASPVGFATFDTTGQCKSVNPAFAEILEISSNEFLNQNIYKIPKWNQYGLTFLAEQTFYTHNTHSTTLQLKTFQENEIWLESHFSYFSQNEFPHILLTIKNVTEEYQAKNKIKESTDLFQTLVNYSPTAVLYADTITDKIIYINEKFVSYFGYNLNHLQKVEDFFYRTFPDGIDRIKSAQIWSEIKLKAAASKNKLFSDNLRFKISSGDIIICETITSLVGNKVVIIFNEKTQKIIDENLIKESERRLKHLLSNIDLFSVVLDRNGNIQFINDFALNSLGYEQKEVLHNNWFDIFVIDQNVKEAFINSFKNDSIQPQFINQIKSKNGEFKLIKWFNSILRDSEGNLIGTASLGEDITEQKLFEDILEFRFKLIELSNNNDIDSIIQFTLDSAEKMTNSKIGFFHYLGEDQNTILLQTWSTNTLVNMCKADGKGKHYDINLAGVWVDCVKQKKAVIHNDYASLPHKSGLPDGHAPIVRELVVPIIKQEKIYAIIGIGNKESFYTQKDIEIVTVLADSAWNIISGKRAEEQLKESEMKLRHLNYTKDRFFSIIAHDLKSPFLGLLGYTNVLIDEYSTIPPEELKEYILGINNIAQNSFKLLQNLLEWAKVQRGDKKIKTERISINEIVSSTFDLIEESARAKKINLENLTRINHIVSSDRTMTETVLRNLITNAIKFSHPMSKIIINSEENNNFIQISVKDFGMGMPSETLSKLFKIEHNISSKGTQNEIGTGLGLILCKEIVELLGGEIWVESEEYKGSKFIFTLPKTDRNN